MNVLRSAALVALAFAASGCNITLETNISLKELFSGKSTGTTGLLKVRVDDCKDSEDVSEARDEVEGMFTDEEFIQCQGSSFGDNLQYRVPIHFDRDGNDNFPQTNLTIYSAGHHAMGIYWPRPMENKLSAGEMGGSHDIAMTFNVVNDTGSPVNLGFNAVYVNDTPVIREVTTAAPGIEFKIELSKVMIDTIRRQGGQTFITREK